MTEDAVSSSAIREILSGDVVSGPWWLIKLWAVSASELITRFTGGLKNQVAGARGQANPTLWVLCLLITMWSDEEGAANRGGWQVLVL